MIRKPARSRRLPCVPRRSLPREGACGGWRRDRCWPLPSPSGYFYSLSSPRPAPLTDKEAVVLADFANTTGDPVFDGTLRQGLAIQLQQSTFLSLTSDTRIQQLLRLMGQPADAKLSPAIARDICERMGGGAIVDGSIAGLGAQYVLGVRATGCPSGEVLGEEQEQVAKKRKTC